MCQTYDSLSAVEISVLCLLTQVGPLGGPPREGTKVC